MAFTFALSLPVFRSSIYETLRAAVRIINSDVIQAYKRASRGQPRGRENFTSAVRARHTLFFFVVVARVARGHFYHDIRA